MTKKNLHKSVRMTQHRSVYFVTCRMSCQHVLFYSLFIGRFVNTVSQRGSSATPQSTEGSSDAEENMREHAVLLKKQNRTKGTEIEQAQNTR